MRLLSLLPLAIVAACGANPPAADAPPPPRADPPGAGHAAHPSDGALDPPDSLEYAVYSAVLRAHAPDEESFFLVMDSTHALRLDLVARASLEADLGEAAPDAAGLFGRLAYVSEKPYPLRPAFSLDDKVRLMPEAEFRHLFGLEPGDAWESHRVDGWSALRARFPGASGRYEFSRVAFDHDRQTALLFYRLRCGNVCENAHYVVARRRGGEWKVGPATSVFMQGDDHTYDTHHTRVDTVVASIHTGPPAPTVAPPPVRVP